MNEKSNFIFNEFKLIMLNELMIIDLSFANMNVICFISNSIK